MGGFPRRSVRLTVDPRLVFGCDCGSLNRAHSSVDFIGIVRPTMIGSDGVESGAICKDPSARSAQRKPAALTACLFRSPSQRTPTGMIRREADGVDVQQEFSSFFSPRVVSVEADGGAGLPLPSRSTQLTCSSRALEAKFSKSSRAGPSGSPSVVASQKKQTAQARKLHPDFDRQYRANHHRRRLVRQVEPARMVRNRWLRCFYGRHLLGYGNHARPYRRSGNAMPSKVPCISFVSPHGICPGP